jgi:iron complex outermembrane receptor protein
MQGNAMLLGALTAVCVMSASAQTEEITAAPAEPAVAPSEELSTISVQGSVDAPAREPERSRSGSRLVEEVVVTAQKREQAIQDVPISVTAFSGDQLQAMGVENTKDLSKVTPGLQFSETAGFTLIYLRGIGTDSFLPYSDPSVATYVDGLYIPAQQGLVNSFGGIERVEVLKGPQGTLFGRNSTGGAINVITKTPGQTTEVSAQAELGNFNSAKAQVYASTPITDSLSASVSAIYNHQSPYYKLITDDLGPLDAQPADNLYADQSAGARVKLRWLPIDELDLGFTLYHIDQIGTGSTIGALTQPSDLATLLGIRAEENDYEIHRNEPTKLRVVNTVVAANATYNLPWFDVKLIGGYQDITTKNAYYDFDNSARSLVSFGTTNAYNYVTTGEFQIASNKDSWNSDRLTWIGGLYYLHSLGGYDPIYLQIAGAAPDLVNTLLPPDRLASVLELLDSIPGLTTDGPGIRANIHGVLRTDSYSAFAQADYNFTDWFNLTLGLRGQTESRFLTKQFFSLGSADGSNELPVLSYHKPEVTQDNLSPKVSLNFRPMQDVLVYLSYSKAYKSGTYNGISIYTPPTYVEPEVINAYELGAKTEFFDHNLRFNAAIYQYKVSDPQVTYISLINGGAITFENAGAARSRGAEFDTLLVPMPHSNPGLVVTAGASYIDAVFTDYQNASGYDQTTGIFRSKAYDFTGNRLPRTAKLSGNFAVSQTLEVTNGAVELSADVYYNDGFYYNAQNTEAASQPSYYLINAHVGYLYEPWKTRITAFAANLNNRAYSFSGFQADFGTNITLAPPRTYGVRLNWDF